jgi:hypothetical protein
VKVKEMEWLDTMELVGGVEGETLRRCRLGTVYVTTKLSSTCLLFLSEKWMEISLAIALELRGEAGDNREPVGWIWMHPPAHKQRLLQGINNRQSLTELTQLALASGGPFAPLVTLS